MSILIAHRGNTRGPNKEDENSIPYIENAINKGYQVEIDLWYKDKLYFGHDNAAKIADVSFLLDNMDSLWCHAKNMEALSFLQDIGMNCFGHNKDDHVLTSWGYIFTLPGATLGPKCVVAMPEWVNYTDEELSVAYGICTDWPERYKL